MPGALSWATVNMASQTSCFITEVYWMPSFVGFRSIKGSSGRVGGSGKRCLQRVWHFSLWVIAGGVFSLVLKGGEANVFFCFVHPLICQTFCAFASDVIF